MSLKMKDPEKNKNSSEVLDCLDPAEESREILMCFGFPTLLLTMNFGLLSIFINGNQIKFCLCSFNQFVFVVMFIHMICQSAILGPAVVYMELKKDDSSTGFAIIMLVRFFHIAGFILLMIRGQWVSRKMPMIWKMCSELVQQSIVNVYGGNCKCLKNLCTYSKLKLFKYVTLLMCNEIYIFLTVPHSLINHGFVEYYNVSRATFDNQFFTGITITAYISWEFCNLSHVLVSLLLAFFISVVMICLKSTNKQIEEIVKELNEKYTVENENYFLVRRTNFVDNLFDVKSNSEREVTAKLEKFKGIITRCEELVSTLNSTFGISVVIEGVIMVTNMLVHAFKILYAFQRCPDDEGSFEHSFIRITNPLDVIGSLLQGFTHFYFFFRLVCLSEEMTSQARRPLKILKELSYSRISTSMQTKIEIFKGDVDKSVIELTAAGYLILNKKLITAVISSITTYLIVLLQLKHQEPEGTDSFISNITAAHKCYSVL